MLNLWTTPVLSELSYSENYEEALQRYVSGSILSDNTPWFPFEKWSQVFSSGQRQWLRKPDTNL